MPVTLDLDGVAVDGSAITLAFLQDGLVRVLQRLATLPPPDAVDPAALSSPRPRVLAAALGYGGVRRQDPVMTREGAEDGGWLMQGDGGVILRLWAAGRGADLDAGARASPLRAAQRVLLAQDERAGLITNGRTLRLLLSDAARPDSFLAFPIEHWRQPDAVPDAARVLAALAGARALRRLPQVLQAAAEHQAKLTAELRRQARDAILGFLNALPTRQGLPAAALWREALLLVYRLLFILKLEGAADGVSFTTTGLWRTALSPARALGPLVRRRLDHGADTRRMLQDGLHLLFRVFRDGLTCNELRVAPLGGGLFRSGATPLLDGIDWGDDAAAILLDRLIWITAATGERARVHSGSLDVEDLGRVYEALLEQEPGIAAGPMIRQRRGKLEAVVPAPAGTAGDIAAGTFFLRAGSGRKASGSYYTPQDFVHFLVRETLAPKIKAASPPADPQPAALLRLRIVDPAMGSGHFLVEACRQLAAALLCACIECDERGLHDRIAALPDRDNSLAPYLPSRGFNEARARAICRRLVATHCLYGSDRNEMAVELARLSLWLESHAEGLPLTFLDHRLIAGDALTGPFFAALATLPVTGGPLDPLLARGVAERLHAVRSRARGLVDRLDASIGRDVEDLAAKELLNGQLDALLQPLRLLAQAWAGAAMLRSRDADDVFLSLAWAVADTGAMPELGAAQQRLLAAGRRSVPWDLQFPEAFPEGFSIVLGNPPWDVVSPNTKDFLAAYDLSVLDPATKPAREKIERRLLALPAVAAAFETYRARFDYTKNIVRRLYRYQRAEQAAGGLDLYRLFAERGLHLTGDGATIGWLLPSSFHAAEGSTGIRKAYLNETTIDWLLSFENRRRIFDIDSRYKFAVLVCRRPGPTRSFRCGFYLDSIQEARDPDRIMTYDTGFLTRSGGPRLTPLELRGRADIRLAETMFAAPHRLGAWLAAQRIRFGCDLHMTHDSGCFLPPGQGDLILHEGKTFHQYTDRWDTAPRHSVATTALPAGVPEATAHRRLAFRDIARSNDGRTMIAMMAPAGAVFGHTATVEKAPWQRPHAHALVLCALFNSFCFDWLVRQKAATHLSLYLLDGLPVPAFTDGQRRFLADAARRLSATRGRDEALRASVDAMVARAYGLDRGAFAHLLSGFSHKSRPDAPAACLAAFDAQRGAPDRAVA